MKTLDPKKLFLIAFALLILTNIVVLTGVYNNRNGEPESKLILTERELRVPYSMRKENSGISLQILWQSLGEKNSVNLSNYQSPVWLTAEKLETLGYKIGEMTQYERVFPSKECFIVLEYDGEAYQKVLEIAESNLEDRKQALRDNPDDSSKKNYYEMGKNTLENRKNFDSRLYAVDAGNDAVSLRGKYPDRSKYIIAKGLINVYYNHSQKKIYGNISSLSTSSIHVPLEFRKVIEPIIKEKQSEIKKTRTYPMVLKHAPRFKAAIAYGKRFEPWIVSIEPYQ